MARVIVIAKSAGELKAKVDAHVAQGFQPLKPEFMFTISNLGEDFFLAGYPQRTGHRKGMVVPAKRLIPALQEAMHNVKGERLFLAQVLIKSERGNDYG
jgi:hypothetical protein